MKTKSIQIDRRKCQYCGKCASVCPKGVFGEKTGLFRKVVQIIKPQACIGCFSCLAVCPNQAITEIKHNFIL
ncbi:4Fe-4S ferredoxin iron-sulfur binding domain protein [Syntrophobotulus glycolicus DSM 8271]|uniref:4Fe-4S ferredoxin iron-sulfur binding domain protein n=1 Tax=Syntrophobotulus glycolicus (strain DSM 8271 / FlGlyR) TaxID=645991 RepID=F0SVN4_SYNGF|nr:4Fe-4S ferredoxin iron-sulfur binding domain protein [Syntrophobotulus glycolicus DSM 8271]